MIPADPLNTMDFLTKVLSWVALDLGLDDLAQEILDHWALAL